MKLLIYGTNRMAVCKTDYFVCLCMSPKMSTFLSNQRTAFNLEKGNTHRMSILKITIVDICISIRLEEQNSTKISHISG